jgi:16S rRNA (guanine966-N2)-methyltransferase
VNRPRGRPEPKALLGRKGLRVIAGSRRGFRLQAPPGLDTRPITDRAKESLFGHLGDHRLLEASVLDLFAGSGAMGIEALSRGAASAVFVDRGPAALDAIAANLRWTGFDDVARVHRGDVTGFLGGPLVQGVPFTLAFCDPPFAMPDEQLATVLRALARPGWLRIGELDDPEGDGATVVVRRAKGDGAPPLPPGWMSTWERTFGDTFVAVIAAAPPPGDGVAPEAGGASQDGDDGDDGGGGRA